MHNHKGGILPFVLIILFVMTLIAMTCSQNVIVQHKIQAAMQNDLRVFAYAELGLQYLESVLRQHPFVLPDTPIHLIVYKNLLHSDPCGNRTYLLQSIASYLGDQVTLQSQAIFARVPIAPHCQPIPEWQVVWWREIDG